MAITQVTKFTKKEEELISILMQLGYRRTIANVLVYIANTREVISRDIERGTELRQQEVSLAMQELKEWDWIAEREVDRNGPGRKTIFLRLVKPFARIIITSGNWKKVEVNRQLEIIRKIRNYIG
jgi:predicted transcriptional regulator